MSMLGALRTIVQEVSAAPDLDAVLDLIVRRIQRAMHTQVCSIYLRNTEDRYVLMATIGLNREAVGLSLACNEGVVGVVAQRAEPLNLEDASIHPAFHYLAATGEERFHAFLGVPIIHQGDVLGVLVVQQYDRRSFDESEVAFMVTVSAQLAGVIAHAEATGSIEALGFSGQPVKPTAEAPKPDRRFIGVVGAPGIAIGTAVVAVEQADLDSVPDKHAKDIATELAGFDRALNAVRQDLREVKARLASRLHQEEQAVFDVYLRMLDDHELPAQVRARIGSGNWAQGALRSVINDYVRQYSDMDDAYLRERASDIRDLGRRLLARLQDSTLDITNDFPDETILVADDLSPSMLALVPEHKLVGLISVSGSSNSHAAIIARAMGIPTVMGIVDLPYSRLDGREMVLDGYSGRVYVNISEGLRQAYSEVLQEERKIAAGLELLRDLPAKTTCGHRMPLWVNTGLSSDVSRALRCGAEGIGLYRTEIPFMTRDFFPSELEQAEIYRRQLQAFEPRPVTMRTLDIGGDKSLPYFPISENNPFLGWRGIRVTLDHPEIFLVQVRAMLRAAVDLDNLRIMLPMITSLSEISRASELIDRAVSELNEEGMDVVRPPVGVMIEVPAAVYQAQAIAKRVDFLSVGSNDLTQYLLAVDRNNPRVAGIYAAYHPAMLRVLDTIAQAAKAESIPVSICGEIAADPAGALLLLAMGYDVLSMNPTNLPRVKSVIRKVSMDQARTLLSQVMRLDDAEAIQAHMTLTLNQMGLGQLLRPRLPDQSS